MDDEFEFNVEDAKIAINTLIWMYSPPLLTLGEAEQRAHAILRIVEREPGEADNG